MLSSDEEVVLLLDLGETPVELWVSATVDCRAERLERDVGNRSDQEADHSEKQDKCGCQCLFSFEDL